MSAVSRSASPFISVVIPTWNRSGLLKTCLASLVAQTYPPDHFEVVVSDDGSTDDTQSVVSEHAQLLPPVRYTRIAHTGANAARNAGISEAGGEIVCLLDDDEVAPEDWLTTVAELLSERQDVDGVGGPYVSWGKPSFRTCDRCSQLGAAASPAGERWLLGGNTAVRRPVLEQVGPFAESLSGNDAEWMHRAISQGARFVFDERIFVWHRKNAQTLTALIRIGYRQGRSWTEGLQAMRLYQPWNRTRYALRYLAHSIGHAITRRCGGGFIGVSEAVGMLAGVVKIGSSYRRHPDRTSQ